MADGLLGKCKSCTRSDVSTNYKARRPQKVAYERERARRPERRQKQLEYQRRRRADDPQKWKAREAVHNAVKTGRLTRLPCEVCGTTARVQGHHDDYSKPLAVHWLCFKHHREEHGQTVSDYMT